VKPKSWKQTAHALVFVLLDVVSVITVLYVVRPCPASIVCADRMTIDRKIDWVYNKVRSK
jgi:hypothetical protein